jgi:hypothetical protein
VCKSKSGRLVKKKRGKVKKQGDKKREEKMNIDE